MSDRITIYPSLFNQTYYSFLSSQLSIDDLIQHALDYHHSAVVITDQKYLFGYMEFYHKVKAANLKPIFGLNINYQNCELILIAKNQKGYCHLIQISSRTPKQSIHPSWFNHLYVIVLQGNFFQQGVDFYYANSKESNGVYVHQTKFKTADDYQVYCALKAIAAIGNQSNVKITLKDTLVSESRYENAYLTYPCPLAKEDQQIHNLFFIIDSCEFYEPPKQKEIIKYDQTIESNDQLRSLAFCGLKKYAKDNNLPVKNNFQQYVDRLNYELKVISDLAFADYFLIVYDFVKYARHHGILVGPGRGSAASSLVAYCLGITKVDPIKYKLYFERFLNPARKSMPDIDIDFMDTKREEVVAYLLKKYTADHLAKIVTFQRWKARGAIRDVGRILGIDLKTIDHLCKNIPLNYQGSLLTINDNYLKKMIENYPKLFTLAEKIIGFPRQTSLHAAGLVLSKAKLGTNFPVVRCEDGTTYTQFSMEYLEELGLLKFDLLGLRNLTIIVNIIELIAINHKKTVNIENLSFDDANIFAQLAKGDTFGIFQLESAGMTKLLKELVPKSLEDIALTNSLYRPGPLKQIKDFLAIRHGKKEYHSLNPKLDSILAPTNGVIVYQEQLIAVVQKVMNCLATEADIFRRAISKKDEKLLVGVKHRFEIAGLNNNYSPQEISQIWNYIYEFANYGFNQPHAISYSMISYWLAWLKYNYPPEFFCAFLKSSALSPQTIQEAKKRGINCYGPSVNQDWNFSIVGNTIYCGLIVIKGLGWETIKKLNLVKQKYSNNQQFTNLTTAICHFHLCGISKHVLIMLNHAGYFDCLFKPQENRKFVDDNFDKIIANNSKTADDHQPLFILEYHYQPYDQKLIDHYATLEYQLLGYSFLKEQWLFNQSKNR